MKTYFLEEHLVKDITITFMKIHICCADQVNAVHVLLILGEAMTSH